MPLLNFHRFAWLYIFQLHNRPTKLSYGMDWQQIAASAVVAATAALFILSWVRPRKFSFKHDTHCGCASAAPGNSMVFRARKGQRREIIVKMK